MRAAISTQADSSSGTIRRNQAQLGAPRRTQTHSDALRRNQAVRVGLLALVDQTTLMERHESLRHRRTELGLQRELLARPVTRGAKPADLARDGAAVPDEGCNQSHLDGPSEVISRRIWLVMAP